jgi:hypothetical protein
MEHHGHAHRLKRPPGELGTLSGGALRQLRAVHVGKVDAGALEDAALLDQTGSAATAFRPFPGIPPKPRAVDRGQPFDDPILQPEEKTAHGRMVHGT